MKEIVKGFGEWLVIIVVAFVLSIVIRNFVIDTRIVPTGSMIPTIQLQDRLIVDRIFYQFDEIRRGDIIVFQAPETANLEDKDLVKRVIGLPGETIFVHQGKVYVNNRALLEGYIKEPPDYEYGPITIPEKSYFMLGDNRNSSKDSHVWGTVSEDQILGRVWVRYWPINTVGKLAAAPDPYYEGEQP